MTGFPVGLEHRAMNKVEVTLPNGAYSLVKKLILKKKIT